MGYHPVVTIEEFYSRRPSFRRGGAVVQPEFLYPIQPGPEVTVLVSGFRPTARVEIISDPACCDIRNLRGRALAAPVGILRDLARPGRELHYPVVAFTGPRYGALTQHDRDLFWHTFEVPVFEQMLGLSGEVLAAECEAHAGLHIDAAIARFESVSAELVVTSRFPGEYFVPRLVTGLSAQIIEGRCPCGRTGARLIDLRPATVARAARA